MLCSGLAMISDMGARIQSSEKSFAPLYHGCKRDVEARDQDETENFPLFPRDLDVPTSYRDRDIGKMHLETKDIKAETTSLLCALSFDIIFLK